MRHPDRSEFVSELYEQRGLGGVVIEQSLELGDGEDGQLACFNQCFDRYKNDTDWFAAVVSSGGLSRHQPAKPQQPMSAMQCCACFELSTCV